MEAKILLEDGTVFTGNAEEPVDSVFGEIVFNTGMTGYQEILTDPSYAGQIVVMTYPLIGNYGVNSDDTESNSIKPNALVVKEFSQTASNWKSSKTVTQYLTNNSTPAISGIDTRMLTKKIRNQGTMNCVVTTGEITDELANRLKLYKFPSDIVSQVSRKDIEIIKGKKAKIGLIDLGIKTGIIRQVAAQGCEVHLLPWNISSDEILKSGLDAVLFSNGPGDPKEVKETIKCAKELLGKIRIFGICLGHQVLALALGADTYKMKFGHRGSNHPVIDLRTNKVQITAQNHGYAVDTKSLPNNMKITHLNVNDETVEGFECREYKIETVQFHPEAGPGPRDCNFIFENWVNSIGNEEKNAKG